MSKHFAIIGAVRHAVQWHMQAIHAIGQNLSVAHEPGNKALSPDRRAITASPAAVISPGPCEYARMQETVAGMRPS